MSASHIEHTNRGNMRIYCTGYAVSGKVVKWTHDVTYCADCHPELPGEDTAEQMVGEALANSQVVHANFYDDPEIFALFNHHIMAFRITAVIDTAKGPN